MDELEAELRSLDAILDTVRDTDKEDPLSSSDMEFFRKLDRASHSMDPAAFPEHVALLLQTADRARGVMREEINRLPHARPTVRREIYMRLHEVKEYVDMNFDKPLHVDSLAARAALSQFHFVRLFKAAFGLSPYQYVLARRLDKAACLLVSSELPIHEVARLTGFDSHIGFSAAFRNAFEIAPSHYRMMGQRNSKIS